MSEGHEGVAGVAREEKHRWRAFGEVTHIVYCPFRVGHVTVAVVTSAPFLSGTSVISRDRWSRVDVRTQNGLASWEIRAVNCLCGHTRSLSRST